VNQRLPQKQNPPQNFAAGISHGANFFAFTQRFGTASIYLVDASAKLESFGHY
jgi:hypothetical protein